MKAHRFLTHCLATPWAMEPSAIQMYAAMLARMYGGRLEVELPAALAPRADTAPAFAAAPTRSGGSAPRGGIAVVRVYGPIAQRASQFGMCEDGTGAEDVAAALNMAMADDTVGQVLLEFDTPGGSVFGIDELATQIRQQRAQKPIVGIANSCCASAGYYLMSQCSEAYCTPGGMVGSIGVFTAHQDISAALEQAGVKVTLISAGKFKTEGNPFNPLGDEAAAATQGQVEGYYGMFTGAVSKGRGVPVATVRDGMGQGRMLAAQDALAQNMIDGVATFAEVVKKMQGDARKARAASTGSNAQARANAMRLAELG